MPVAILSESLSLAYDVQGSGTPLLLLGGLASDRTSWRGLDAKLAGSFRVVTQDLRGTGESRGGSGPYRIASLADDAARLLDHLDVSAAHVVGVSMGGMVALELALRHAPRVLRLVLGCTHPGGSLQLLPEKPVLDDLWRTAGDASERAHRLVARMHRPEFAEEDPRRWEVLLAEQAARQVSARIYAAQLGAIRTHDVASRLGEIGRPVLVLSGDRDALVPVENARLLAERIPGARLTLLPGIGHAFWVEAEEAAAREISAFLLEDSPAPRGVQEPVGPDSGS